MIQQQVEFVAAWMQTKFGIELFGDKEEGQGLVEYALILVLVSIASIALMKTMSTQIGAVFTSVTSALS